MGNEIKILANTKQVVYLRILRYFYCNSYGISDMKVKIRTELQRKPNRLRDVPMLF